MNTLDARRRLLGRNVYKKTVEGNPAIAQGSLARMYPGIEMQGWTEQKSTTGAQLFDKSTAISGKYISDTDGKELDGEGTYTSDYIAVSGLSNIICSDTKSSEWMAFYDAEKTYVSGKNGYDAPIPVPENAFYARFTIDNDSIDSFMVNAGQTLLPYEPYTGEQPSPSPDYKQDVKNAGKYDEETQKWEYEITIANEQTDATKNQTITLTSDRPLTKWDRLEKRNGQWGWVYKSAEIESYTDESVPGEYYSTTGQLSVGAQVWYETATETFVPLSPEEQEQMNALHTFRPTTVLSNDCNCNMSLTYKTKKSMGGGNPYGIEIGMIAGNSGGNVNGYPNRIRTGYITFYSPDGDRTIHAIGYTPFVILATHAYDKDKKWISQFVFTEGIPPAGTNYVRYTFRKIDGSNVTSDELNNLIKTFDVERSD